MWICTQCGAQLADTMSVCPNKDGGESPSLIEARKKAVEDAVAKKAADAKLQAEAAAAVEADKRIQDAVNEATK